MLSLQVKINKETMDDVTERMFATSTIDDPVETRQLYLDMEAILPIPIYFSEKGLAALEAQGIQLDDYQKSQLVCIESLNYSGDMGGILCEIIVEIEDDDNNIKLRQLILSITHLKVDPNDPLAERIKKYQKKRALALAIANSGANSGTKRASTKPKRNKRGFGS